MNLFFTSDFMLNRTLPVTITRRDPKPEFELHSHEFSELVIVYRGTGDHLIFGEKRKIEAGDVFLISGQTSHGYANLKDLALFNLMFDLHTPGNPLPAFCGYPALRALFQWKPVMSSNVAGFRLKPEELRPVLELLDEMEREQTEQRPNHPMALSALFVLLTVELGRFYKTSNPEPDHGSAEAFQRLLNEIARDPCKVRSRESMAKAAGMSPSTLTRHFKSITGYAPNEFLISARLRKAALLLPNKDLSISEIAEQSGFSDSNYFCRQFRKHFGSSPVKYRNRTIGE